MLIDCPKVNRISDQLSRDVELTILAVRHGLSDASAINNAS